MYIASVSGGKNNSGAESTKAKLRLISERRCDWCGAIDPL